MTLSPAARSSLLLVALFGACAGLAYQWFDEDGQPRNRAWARPAPLPAVLPSVALQEPAGIGTEPAVFVEISERSMWAVDRRLPPPPPPPKPPAPPPPPDPLAGVKVFGLIMGEQGMALMRVEGKLSTLKLGGQVGDWQLKTIEERSLTFVRGEKGEEQRTLRLEYAKLSAPVAPRGTQAGRVNSMGLPVNTPNPAQPGASDPAASAVSERARQRAEFRARMGQ